MKLINKSQSKVISNRVLKSGARGLMFRKKLKEHEAILLDVSRESRLKASVHMFFVFYPIDVVWLDNDLRVVDMARKLLPFTPFRMPKKSARYILEMPAKSAEEKGIRLGDLMEIN